MATPRIHANIDDYYLLDEALTDSQLALRDKVRAFANDHALPIINDYWERAEVPFELIEPYAKLQIAGGFIPGYGAPGLSRVENGIVSRELGRVDGSLSTFFGVHSGLAMGSIYVLGDEEQRQRWLPDMAAMKKLGAFALTEPAHGSDSVSLETSARKDGDGWVLNGHKRWIGNGHIADLTVLYARDEDDGQVKAFVVEKVDGQFPEGYEPTPITGKVGKRAIIQGDIRIKDVYVSEANRLHNCDSFRDVNKVLALTRGSVSWEATGHAIAGLELAAHYALEREQFGAPIASFQLVQEKLATMLGLTVQSQMMCMRMAQLQEEGKFDTPKASLAKMMTCRNAIAVCREARDMLGGNGLLLENHVARHLTDMEVAITYEGTDSVQALLVGRDITGISAFTTRS